jgi:hypothetical protein
MKLWMKPIAGAVLVCWATLQAQAQDVDPLSLQSAPPEPTTESPWRVAFEAGVGALEQRFASPEHREGHRFSLDVRYAGRLGDHWRLAFSDRIDRTHPAAPGQQSTVNSLREAALAWQSGDATIDFGRINFRQGPAFGYNPTDFFRTGGLRTVPTADPVALRELRMGSAMVRWNQLWSGTGVTIALAPRIEDREENAGSWDADFGATNSVHRGVATLSRRFSERFNGQLSLLAEDGRSPALGASATALLGDAWVAYGEWATRDTVPLVDLALATPGAPSRRIQQAAAGVTYTLPNALALTLEVEHNGAGLDRNAWERLLAGGPPAYTRYATLTQRDQELGSRRAWLLYATQKDFITKRLDFTAFVRTNTVDDSRFAWAELRYRWPRFDAALQWQRASGHGRSEFGLYPYRQLVQLLGVFYL